VLDCAWLTGSGNCFRAQLTAAAQNCAIPDAGTLSADGTKCTFPSGAVVTFAMSLDTTNTVPDFSVDTDGGGACLSGGFPADGVFITTSAGRTSVASNRSTQTITLTCPDGTIYAGSFASLSACDGAFPGLSVGAGVAPGDSGPISMISIAIPGADIGMAQDSPIFSCSAP
jgi:hypothetical protein